MTQNLSLVSTPPPLSGREIIRSYADYLKSESWCVEISSYPLKALHANTNHNAIIDEFKYRYPQWAKAKGVHIAPEKYSEFLNTLVDRLMPYLPRIVDSAMRPTDEKFFDLGGVLIANTFSSFRPAVSDIFEMPTILQEYLDRIFSNSQDRKFVIEWLADIIQNPERRPMWSVVLTGDQGSGKSLMFRLVSAALGFRHTVELSQYAPAFEKFSEVLSDHLLVSFDDAVSNRDTYQKLKQVITRKSMSVELKGIQKRVVREVYARILICSNSPRPLSIEEGDRRLYVAEPVLHKESKEESAAFFVKFNDWLDEPSTPTIIYHWLKTVDLSDFVPGSTIQTQAHKQMVGLSVSVLKGLLSDFVEGSPIFHNETLLKYLDENGCKNIKPDLIKFEMSSLNYEQKRRKVTGCEKGQIYVWQERCLRSRSLTDAEEKNIQQAVNCHF